MRQRGLSLIGLLLVSFIGVVVLLIGAQVVPTISEYREIQTAVNRAAQSGTTAAEIRSAFDRAKMGGYFQAISGQDLKITKQGDRWVVDFAYDKEIHLVGPAYLVIKYQGRSQ
jgi:Tfp pilus assembly protein PilW